MSIELYDAVNHDGLFDLQGKAFYAQQILNTARGTTVPQEVVDIITQFEKLTDTIDLTATISSLPSGVRSWQASGDALASVISKYCSQILIEMANADTKLPSKTIEEALKELIKQMKASSDTVNANAVTVAVSVGGSNTGDGRIVFSKKRADGLVQENALGDLIAVTVTSDTSPATASLTFTSPAAVTSLLDEAWPGKSGLGTTLTAVDAASNLLTNSEFENSTVQTNVPDSWIVSVGTVGTTLKLTVTEVQTLTIAGTPTSGYYQVSWQNAAGKTQTTTPLAYNAAGSDLQSALRSLAGLESVTVGTTGSSPNYTHTITFTGRGGNLTEITATNNFDTGTITPATTTQGTAQVYSGGKALWFASNGSELTTINQQLTNLTAATAYGLSLWSIADASIAAGVITIDLVDGVGGTVINDDQGTANSITFNASSLTTSWKHLVDLVGAGVECVFRTPTKLPALIYLRIRISTAVTNGRSVFFDRVALSEMRELYAGGPFVCPFSGAANFRNTDAFTITVTNDRAAKIQEWYHRNFNMAALGLLLPSNSAGGETIPDSVVG
jgi:hypothetical protein